MKQNKQKSLILLIISLVVAAICVFVTVFGVKIGGEEKGSARNIVLGLDLKGGVSITYQAVGDFTSDDFQDTITKLKRRAEEFSVESDVYQEGENRITVDIPGEDDADAVLQKLGKPGSLEFITEFGTDNAKVWLTGADIDSAKAITNTDQTTGALSYEVSFKLTEEAAPIFAEATTAYRGKIIYVVYDGEVISSPSVNSTISGGQGVINGMGSLGEAEDLAAVIRIGSLKVELEELTSKVVSAKLGDDALNTSVMAGAIGLLIVIVFMIAVYRLPGVVASVALVIYTALELLALNGFNMTLTLPGIAGVILSIGMAVDANVIIYARIKEEIAQNPKNIKGAIDTGFKKATSAIVDGNVTTFIAALVLMVMGTGTIKGFAQTLAIGIVISMFTAMVVSRFFMNALFTLGCDKVWMYGIQKERKTINFLGLKWICFGISIVAVLIGIITMVLSGSGKIADRNSELNYSVEFQGGLSITVDFEENYDIDFFNDNIKPRIAEIIEDEDIVANAVIDSNKYVIRIKDITEEEDKKSDDVDNANDVDDTKDVDNTGDTEEVTKKETTKQKLKAMLEEEFGAIDFDETTVSATTSGEMRRDAIISVIIAIICMLIYIFVRFKDIRFASSAIIALVHDVLIVLTFYALSWTNVGNTFIACMLTIVGYSINATIVIFDRIRENMAIKGDKYDRKELVNESITQTLTRTLYTTFTTVVMVVVLYLLGVTAIKEFALPLIVGLLCGAYASVFVTGALWYIMGGKNAKSKQINI